MIVRLALSLVLAAGPISASHRRPPSVVRGPSASATTKVMDIDWSSSGSWDYSTAGSIQGPTAAPTPTLDCKLAGWTAGQDLTCTGGTGTLGGNPTATTSPFYPTGFSDSAATWATFDGSGDSFSFGDTLTPAGDFTVCATLRPASVSGFKTVFCKKTDAKKGPFCLYISSASLVLTTNKDASTATTFSVSSAMQANSIASVCVSYDYVGATNSIIDASVNGSNESAISNAVGPPMTADVPLVLGQYSDLSSDTFNGSIYRVTYWNGWAASSAELAALSKSQMGMIPSKGGEITLTRASIQSCIPTSTSNLFYVGKGMPCITQYGLQSWGSGGNKLPSSEDSTAWAVSNTSNARDVTAPDGTANSGTTTSVSSDGDARSTSQDFTATAAITSCSMWIKSGSVSTADLGIYQSSFKATAGATVLGDCTVATSGSYQHVTTTANWCRVRITTSSALSAAAATLYLFPAAATGQVTGNTVSTWGWQCEAASYPSPYYPTAGSALTWEPTLTSMPSAFTGTKPSITYFVGMVPSLTGSTQGLYTAEDGSYSTIYREYIGAGPTLYFGVSNGTFLYKYGAIEDFVAGTEFTSYSYRKGPVLSLDFNGIARTSTTGSGTAIVTGPPSTLYVGQLKSSATMNGYVRRLVQCSGTNHKTCK